MCLSLHRSSPGARGLAHPGGEAAAASQLSPGERGPGAGDQRPLEEAPGAPRQDRCGPGASPVPIVLWWPLVLDHRGTFGEMKHLLLGVK